MSTSNSTDVGELVQLLNLLAICVQVLAFMLLLGFFYHKFRYDDLESKMQALKDIDVEKGFGTAYNKNQGHDGTEKQGGNKLAHSLNKKTRKVAVHSNCPICNHRYA
ncbi:hypothetical protein GRF29_161g1220443 [Pseudopithomyces chartarum]|uniref:Uncharacterized protein n=1 Tax=Pseudopithomyces chartarum TaxID=1892770 RepID=A0AAN6LSG1_9PLEO|nr:hypothetical protein GRF29_161g1220443 [Pseudopithomyces chartarum]